MAVLRNPLQHGLSRAVESAARAFTLGEQGQLPVGRQLAVPEQVRDLLERAVLGEILDGVTAIGQRVGLRYDLGDGRGVDDDTGEPFVDGGGVSTAPAASASVVVITVLPRW